MPPNTRGYLVRRCHQADEGLKRAQKYMASIMVTVREQHPEMVPQIYGIIGRIDVLRSIVADFQAERFKNPGHRMWKPDQMGEIIASARPVPHPE